MLSNCPNCHQQLQLSAAQQEKVNQALSALPEGRTLKIACPLCRQPIHLNRAGDPVEQSAAAAGPASGPAADASGAADPAADGEATATVKPPPEPVKEPPPPPAPPDISWLQDDTQQPELEEVVRDAPLAMVLIADETLRQQAAEALEGLDYQVEMADSAAAAIERMRFVNFAAVVLDSAFEGGSLADSGFHQHIRRLPMASRRLMLYVLLGPDFSTLYDLEALAHSANLVVNRRDAAKLPLILKKGLHDYQQLFGPYLDALKEHNKL